MSSPLTNSEKSMIQRAMQLIDQNQFQQALNLCDQVLSQKPKDPHALGLLGEMSYKVGKYEEARKFFEASIQQNKLNMRYYNYLGATFVRLGEYEKALEYLMKVSKERPNADILTNIASIYNRIGPYEESISYLKEALKYVDQETAEKGASIYLSYYAGLELMQRHDEMQKVIEKARKKFPDSGYLSLFRLKESVTHFIQGDFDAAVQSFLDIGTQEEMDQKLNTLIQKMPDQRKIIVSYGAYFRILLGVLNEEVLPNTTEPGSLPPLYMVGDSHSVPAAWQKAHYNGQDHQIVTKLVRGIKAWHCISNSGVAYKAGFLSALDNLPKGATFIASVGEIDCRMDEGVIQASLKRNKDPQLEVINMVEKFVAWLVEESKKRDITPILYGVPAPRPRTNDPNMLASIQLHVNVIKLFNSTLKGQAKKYGLDMVDPYTATATEKGLKNDQYLMDGLHLNPPFYVDAFEKYFIKNSA